MRKFVLPAFLTVLLLSGCVSMRQGGGEAVCDCQRAVKVPDPAFRTFLVDSGYAVKSGWQRLKPTAKGCALTTLECYGRSIHSLEGIGMFPQLTSLTCSDNPIAELDLGGLPQLESLYALDVPLRRFDAGECCHLKYIQLSHTSLDTFDLAPLLEVESLLIIFSPLTEIDLTPCKQLKTLYIRGTQITEVDLSGNPDMRELHALDTPLRTLKVSPKQYDGDVRASVSDSVRIEVR